MKKLLCMLFSAGALLGQNILSPNASPAASTLPPVLRNVGIDQKLNQPIPPGLIFRDETGRSVALQEYFGRRPVVLALVYYDCPMLCTQILSGLVSSLKAVSFNAGREFQVVAVSFDARETPALAAAKKKTHVKHYDRPGTADGWHFLTGDQHSIQALTDSVGFRYNFDPKTNQFAHASAIMILTPQGKISRYFYGVEYAPRDVRLGLVEASQGKIGTPVDQVLLFCYHYDPSTGKYTNVVLGGLRAAAVATVLLIGGFVFVMLRRDSSRARG